MSNPATFTLIQWETPQHHRRGFSKRAAVYADCADCGSVGPLIGGHIQTEDGTIAIVNTPHGQEFAFFCVACTRERWLEIQELRSAHHSESQ